MQTIYDTYERLHIYTKSMTTRCHRKKTHVKTTCTDWKHVLNKTIGALHLELGFSSKFAPRWHQNHQHPSCVKLFGDEHTFCIGFANWRQEVQDDFHRPSWLNDPSVCWNIFSKITIHTFAVVPYFRHGFVYAHSGCFPIRLDQNFMTNTYETVPKKART